MARIGISLYLMLVSLVGPGLCCCTITRAWGCQACCASSTQQDHHHHSGCCHHHDSTPKPETPKNPDGPSCPCKDHGAIPVALLRSDLENAKQLKTSLELGLVFESMAFVAASTTASPVHDGQALLAHALWCPFQSPAGILCALCILRC